MKNVLNVTSGAFIDWISNKVRVYIFPVILILMMTVQEGYSEQPIVRVRFFHPVYNEITKNYYVDVEFQSNTPNLVLFGMNLRFLYDDAVLEFQSVGDFEGDYMSSMVSVTTNPPSSATLFGFTGPMEYCNGVVELYSMDQLRYKQISMTGWTKLFSICFHVDAPSAFTGTGFCPSIVWDLQMNPNDGSFLHGSSGVVMTVIDPEGLLDSAPVTEEVVQFNWAYDGTSAPPYGAPVSFPETCLGGDTVPPVITTQAVSGNIGCNPADITEPVFHATDNIQVDIGI